MTEIQISIMLEDQFIYDVLTTTVESDALSSWGMFSEVNREVDTHDVLSTTLQDAGWHTLTDWELQDEIAAGHRPEFTDLEYGYDDVIEGIRRVLLPEDDEEHVRISHHILSYIHRGVREQDAGDIDSVCCDVIAQAALFGEVRFS